MDFAEFSDIETVGFATYKQNLQEQFQQEVEQDMIFIYSEQVGSSLQVLKVIPLIGNAIHIVDKVIEEKRMKKEALPDKAAKSILSRVTTKFNETMDHIGKYVHVIQGKLTIAEEQLEIKQAAINSLTAELDQMKEVFLAPDENNTASDVKRLKFQLRQANISIVQLQKKLKACEDSYKRQSTLDLNRIKAQHERKILEHQKTLNDIIRRNKQLQDKLNEEFNKKSKDDDIYTLTHVAVWVGDKIARAAGLKDVATFGKNFAIMAEAAVKGAMVLGYAYTFYNNSESHVYWAKNYWKGPLSKFYSITTLLTMIFCMVKLLGF